MKLYNESSKKCGAYEKKHYISNLAFLIFGEKKSEMANL